MPPSAPNHAASARSARATRWHARSSCSARCSARSSSSRRARTRSTWSSASVARPSASGAAARTPTEHRLTADLADVSLPQAEVLIRAFSLYFQLTNLAEEKQRVRQLRTARAARRKARSTNRSARPCATSPATAAASELERLVGRLSIAPVLTAHPTEARRRTLLVALRRVYRLLDALDDPRLTPSEDAEIRRRLREQISILWHVVPIRATAPGPLDEVRSAMALFDESLFVVVPRLYRSRPARAARRGGTECRHSCTSARGSAAIVTATRA